MVSILWPHIGRCLATCDSDFARCGAQIGEFHHNAHFVLCDQLLGSSAATCASVDLANFTSGKFKDARTGTFRATLR